MRGKGEFKHIHDVVPWPDFARQDLVVLLSDDTARRAAPTGLRVIKTHLERERIPYTCDARYICILVFCATPRMPLCRAISLSAMSCSAR